MLDINLLRKQTNDMRVVVQNGSFDTETLKKEYEYLFLKTPSIWHMVHDNEEDYTSLLEILLEKAEEYHKTKPEQQENKLEKEHHEVNELLAEKYVYPVVGKKSN